MASKRTPLTINEFSGAAKRFPRSEDSILRQMGATREALRESGLPDAHQPHETDPDVFDKTAEGLRIKIPGENWHAIHSWIRTNHKKGRFPHASMAAMRKHFFPEDLGKPFLAKQRDPKACVLHKPRITQEDLVRITKATQEHYAQLQGAYARIQRTPNAATLEAWDKKDGILFLRTDIPSWGYLERALSRNEIEGQDPRIICVMDFRRCYAPCGGDIPLILPPRPRGPAR